MPKERKDRSGDHSRVSPFHCSSSSSRNKHSLSIKPSESIQEIKEWEEARCPVCMEHPHNAVLLLCSSHDKGCHPYMCDTSYRHSNCLDQFRKAFGAESATNAESASNPQDSSPNSSNSAWLVNAEEQHLLSEQLDGGELQAPSTLIPCNGLDLPKLSCPLCRGHIKGWIVEEPARKFMNAKIRSCSSELCPFNGTYTDLRKHARVEHPLARPSEVDQERQRNWRRLERQRDLGDVLSTIQSALGGGEDNRGLLDDEIPIPIVGDDGGWLTVYFLVRVFRPPGQSWSTVPSRLRGMARSRRRMSLWGESYDDVESATREEDNNTNNDDEGLEEMSSSSWHRRVRSQRRTTPENDEG